MCGGVVARGGVGAGVGDTGGRGSVGGADGAASVGVVSRRTTGVAGGETGTACGGACTAVSSSGAGGAVFGAGGDTGWRWPCLWRRPGAARPAGLRVEVGQLPVPALAVRLVVVGTGAVPAASRVEGCGGCGLVRCRCHRLRQRNGLASQRDLRLRRSRYWWLRHPHCHGRCLSIARGRSTVGGWVV